MEFSEALPQMVEIPIADVKFDIYIYDTITLCVDVNGEPERTKSASALDVHTIGRPLKIWKLININDIIYP